MTIVSPATAAVDDVVLLRQTPSDPDAVTYDSTTWAEVRVRAADAESVTVGRRRPFLRASGLQADPPWCRRLIEPTPENLAALARYRELVAERKQGSSAVPMGTDAPFRSLAVRELNLLADSGLSLTTRDIGRILNDLRACEVGNGR